MPIDQFDDGSLPAIHRKFSLRLLERIAEDAHRTWSGFAYGVDAGDVALDDRSLRIGAGGMAADDPP